MQQTENSILVFENTEFDVVDLRNIPWLRCPQIGDALGYEKGRISVHKLYEANADEFTEEMTQIIELDTAGGRQPVRIFSPRGCYLIGMLSRTEKSKAFRQWVLDVLEGRQPPRQSICMTVPQQLAALRYRGTLINELASTRTQGVAVELYANLRHVSRLLAMPISALDTLVPALRQGSLEVTA
ncbi:BRO-N domain-containing protein [Glaciimonas sp. GG7]